MLCPVKTIPVLFWFLTCYFHVVTLPVTSYKLHFVPFMTTCHTTHTDGVTFGCTTSGAPVYAEVTKLAWKRWHLLTNYTLEQLTTFYLI